MRLIIITVTRRAFVLLAIIWTLGNSKGRSDAEAKLNSTTPTPQPMSTQLTLTQSIPPQSTATLPPPQLTTTQSTTLQPTTTQLILTQLKPLQSTPSQSTPTQPRATQQTQPQPTPSQQTPSHSTPTPTQQTTTPQHTPSQSTPPQSTPPQPTPTQQTPSQSTPTQQTPPQPTPTQQTPSQPTPTQQTPSQSTTPKSTTISPQEEDNKNLEGVLIAVAVIAIIAAVIAITFLVLYLRTTYFCYQALRPRRSCVDAFQLENVRDEPSPRERLTSFSSLRKHAICKSDPFVLTAFPNHVKRLHSDSDYLFSMEYEAIGNKKYLSEKDKKIELTCLEGKKVSNKPKNRYTDILPYDHCRVILTELDDDPDSSYINASYVDSYRKERAYIAAQGPLSTTLGDFWRMIWESNSRVIVMATNLFEKSKSKCIKYWPDRSSADYGLIRVTILKEEAYANYIVRSFSIQPIPDQTHYIMINGKSESRIIKQFHYTEWPDHGVPVHPAAILRYISKSKAASPEGAGPIVIHCSAGVGRTGSYIVIDSMMERIDDDKTVDIFNFLSHIRTQRVYLVQEEVQYVFVHDAILEYINFGDSNIPIREFQEHVESLMTVNSSTKKTGLMKEFEDIDNTKTSEKHKWAAKKTCNTLKNRRKDVLPVERTRVKLPPILGNEGADYINASHIDGFTKKREYIATQSPMITTAQCFWRMICAVKCKIIVMLLDEEEWKKDDYFADLPTQEEAVVCGKFEIQLESEEITDHVTVRKLRVLSSDTSIGQTVTHYHYRNWSANGFPNDRTSLIDFIKQVRNHKITETEKAPITVYCDHGVGRTGVFCLLSTVYDQLESERSVDIYQTAKLYRVQRPKLIETEEQYKFCYDIMNQVVTMKLATETANGSVKYNTNSAEPVDNPNLSNVYTPIISGIDNPGISATDSSDNSDMEKPHSSGTEDPSGINHPAGNNNSDTSGNDNPQESGNDNPNAGMKTSMNNSDVSETVAIC